MFWNDTIGATAELGKYRTLRITDVSELIPRLEVTHFHCIGVLLLLVCLTEDINNLGVIALLNIHQVNPPRCPACRQTIRQTRNGFNCENCNFVLRTTKKTCENETIITKQ